MIGTLAMQTGAQAIVAPNPLSMDDFEHVHDMLLRRLISYWLQIRGSRRMPSRTDIDPVEIRWALSCIWLCDYDPTADKFRYRLAGEDINRANGRGNLAGAYVEDMVSAAKRSFVSGKYRKVRAGPAVLHDNGQVYLLDERPAIGERLVLPLSSDGAAVDGILGATIYRVSADIAERRRWAGRQDTRFTPV